ncbi:MAG TPA: ArsR family transcriptional regulator [Firmicutes bacterium]|nr:ArsR family transcriptional regulator [Bacillota bacterium]
MKECLLSSLKIFSNDTRLRILNLLSYHPMNVKQLSQILKIYQSKLSHQLLILRSHKILKTRKRGRFIIYSIDAPISISPLFKIIFKSMHIESTYQKDITAARKLLHK